jgi:hypothetical protein
VDGWYSLRYDGAVQPPGTQMYVRAKSEAKSQSAVLGYRRGWWFIATISMQELDQAAQPEVVLAERLVAVANDCAEHPEKICAGWQRRARTGEGTGSQCVPFCTETTDEDHSKSEGLVIDTICCGTITISTSTLCLPLVHRTAIEFLLTTQRWNQLGLAAVVESDSSPRAAELEGQAFLQAALNNVKSARQSKQHEHVIGSKLLAKMEQASPIACSKQVGAKVCDEQPEQGADELMQARRWRRRCEEKLKNASR